MRRRRCGRRSAGRGRVCGNVAAIVVVWGRWMGTPCRRNGGREKASFLGQKGGGVGRPGYYWVSSAACDGVPDAVDAVDRGDAALAGGFSSIFEWLTGGIRRFKEVWTA